MIWIFVFIIFFWCWSNEDDIKALTKKVKELEKENSSLRRAALGAARKSRREFLANRKRRVHNSTKR